MDEIMARRRKYRYIIDPTLKAAAVVGAFLEKVTSPDELRRMAEHYQANLREYARDTARQEFAALKLAAYYVGMSDPEVRNAIRAAVGRAKEKQAEIVNAAIASGKVPVPALKGKAAELAKKVGEILVPAAPTAGAPAA